MKLMKRLQGVLSGPEYFVDAQSESNEALSLRELGNLCLQPEMVEQFTRPLMGEAMAQRPVTLEEIRQKLEA